MNVQNLMEAIVESEVNKLYEQAKKEKAAWLTCDCPNCRMDTICYVLNRIPPKYVVSSRGITHVVGKWDNHQISADLDTIAFEGMKIVSSTKRPFHSQNSIIPEKQKEPVPAFNFPAFLGNIIDGATFEPISGATVLLKSGSKQAQMVDKSWTNPCVTCDATKGTYSFWVKAEPAKKEGLNKKFKFTLEISAEGYTPLKYNFEVPAISDAETKYQLESTFSLKLKDIVLFKEDYVDEADN